MISVFGQWSGNGLGYFNATIFKAIGYESSSTQLLLNLVNSIISAVGALTAVYFTDRMRRRPVLIFGTLGKSHLLSPLSFVMVSPANQHIACAVALGINAGILQEVANTGFISKNKGKAALAFYYLFNVVFSFTYTPLQGVIPAEALETTTRSKGLALSGFMVSSISFISQFATPIGLANISTNYFWIFVGWDVVESVFWYFFWYAYSDSVYTPLTYQIHFVLTPATTVSNPRAELWNSWSGFTSSPTPSRPRSMWTKSLFRRMVPLPRRSKPMLE